MNLAERTTFGQLRARSVIIAILSFVAALLFSAPAATASANPAAHARPVAADSNLPKTIRVGTEGVYPPFSFHSGGKLTGYDVEYFREVGKRIGVNVEFVETPWDSMFAGLDAGRIDLIANQVTKNDERQAKYALSDTYVTTTGVVVTQESNNSIKKLSDLKGKKSAQNITSDWASVAKRGGASIVSVEGMDKAAALLQEGRVDAFVNDELAVKYYLATHPNSGLKIAYTTDDKSESVFTAKKNSNVMPAVNNAIKQMESDGTSKQLYDKYFTAKPKAEGWLDVVKNNIGPMLAATVKATIPLTIITFALGLVLALAVALARLSSNAAISWLARAFISIFRGTPLIVQLFIIFFGLPQLGLKFNSWIAAGIALSLNVAAYAAEIIRSAILSVPKGQWEAAETIGMSCSVALKRIVLPQAARVAVPPLSNTLISLVKDTSLAATIGVSEMFRQAQIAAAPSGDFLQLYLVAAAIYWVLCFVLSVFQTRMEDRLGKGVAR